MCKNIILKKLQWYKTLILVKTKFSRYVFGNPAIVLKAETIEFLQVLLIFFLPIAFVERLEKFILLTVIAVYNTLIAFFPPVYKARVQVKEVQISASV